MATNRATNQTDRNGRVIFENCEAFSLVTLVVSVAIIGIVSTLGLISISKYRTATIEQKLRADVTTLNSASRVFVGSGGNFTGTTTVDEVLTRLKSVASSATADEVVGLRGAMIDTRTSAVPLPTTEESSDVLRANWNATTMSFELSTSGAGIKEFTLSGTSGSTSHQRTTAVKYGKEDDWIWDYTDRDTTRPAPPSDDILLAPETAPPSAEGPESAVALNAPTISVPGGVYSLSDFPIEISIVPGTGNPEDTVEFFSFNGGSSWSKYTDPFTVNPDTEVIAYAASSDPDNYIDSSQVSETYETSVVQLEFALQSGKTNYTYAELGGKMMSGSPPTPLAQPATFDLLNGASIPLSYQNSETFEIRYTYDGLDPLSDPANSIAGDSFIDGFPGQNIPISLAAFGTNNILPIQAAGRSLNPAVVQDSNVENVVITGDVTTLPSPTVTVNPSSGEVSLDLVLDNADVPEDAYIYYTIDGTDPGFDSSDVPLEGQLYSTPFTPEADVEIVARVYPPESIANWFDVSPPVLETLVLPNYDVYIGGDFYLDGTAKTHRNVARLAANGLVDTEFNPGNGANAGSIVGTVLRQGGNSVLVSGDFQTMSGVVRPAIVQLDSTGAIVGGFDAGLE